MYYIHGKTIVQSLLEELYEKKYIRQSGRLCEFCINRNELVLNIYNDGSPLLLSKTIVLEKNVKGEFGICEDEQKLIHIIVANKKYDLIYMKYDGENLEKEIIYAFNNHFLIPTTPAIQVKNELVVIASEFLTAGTPKEWILRVYIKRNQLWDDTIIDKGAGLCYIHPDFRLTDQGYIHLVYRELKDRSYLKYISFDVQKPLCDKAKMIPGHGTENIYAPSIFINPFNEVFAVWIEISDKGIDICCSNIGVDSDSNREIFKINIPQNISDVRLFFTALHIYCAFLNEEGFYYDMCCRKKVMKQENDNLIPKREGDKMSSDLRLFLDIKRELEYQISELTNHVDADSNVKAINELKNMNIDLIKQIDKKEISIEAAIKENQYLRTENEEYKNIISQLKQQLEVKQPGVAKPPVRNRILHFFCGDETSQDT